MTRSSTSRLVLGVVTAVALLAACGDDGGPSGITSERTDGAPPAFDVVQTVVEVDDDDLVFRTRVAADAGSDTPAPAGALDGAPVWSYVWPTSLDSSSVGFEPRQGILALAATVHPDFDDTPLYDENGDGDVANDGADWHTHWVVLTESADCGGGLAVRDIPDGETPTLPPTWPELPILIDSPDIPLTLDAEAIEIRIPASAVGAPEDFDYDGVTSGLRVSTDTHDPLLCVEVVFDVASGDLSLPGTVGR